MVLTSGMALRLVVAREVMLAFLCKVMEVRAPFALFFSFCHEIEDPPNKRYVFPSALVLE